MTTINETPYLTTNDKTERTINEIPYLVTGGGGGGTSDYNDLENKPKINGAELSGDKATGDLFSAGEGISFEDGQIGVDFNVVATNYRVNEVESIAKGANQAIAYDSYSAMVTAVNALEKDAFNAGQNVMIVTLEVPDLWVSKVENTSVPYTYTTDAAIVSALETTGYIQVGYFKLSALETQKVDLTNYVENTDYATTTNAGVIKAYTGSAFSVNGNGIPSAASKTYAEYETVGNGTFIGKGTLENVITGKGLNLNTEAWTFSMADGTTVTKNVKVSA